MMNMRDWSMLYATMKPDCPKRKRNFRSVLRVSLSLKMRIGKKILEALVLAGVVTFLGLVFLIEVFDLFLIRPIYQRLFKKKRRKKSRVLNKGAKIASFVSK